MLSGKFLYYHPCVDVSWTDSFFITLNNPSMCQQDQKAATIAKVNTVCSSDSRCLTININNYWTTWGVQWGHLLEQNMKPSMFFLFSFIIRLHYGLPNNLSCLHVCDGMAVFTVQTELRFSGNFNTIGLQLAYCLVPKLVFKCWWNWRAF